VVRVPTHSPRGNIQPRERQAPRAGVFRDTLQEAEWRRSVRKCAHRLAVGIGGERSGWALVLSRRKSAPLSPGGF